MRLFVNFKLIGSIAPFVERTPLSRGRPQRTMKTTKQPANLSE
ncbi:hypothetical protein LCGC14_1295090 [marine sediment metagenome]|uniref:Uncharacterized protein n=1 Tax=marine sediment metagenome TaxID=412755 RepID=A0A0F9N7V4_9ZZZZ